MNTNIELKLKVPSFSSVKKHLRLIGAERKEVLRQVDTYFSVPKGRLKLRESNGTEFQLILYERRDTLEPKVSKYEVLSLERDASDAMKTILAFSLGVMVVVRKKRELWMYKHTRVHLDTVEGLGSYVELETILNTGGMKKAKAEHSEVVDVLGLEAYEKSRLSYSDMFKNMQRK